MLLRKLIVAVCPLILCAIVCAAFRWLDGWLSSGAFWAFVFKGVLLGALLASVLPIAGVRFYTNGLTGWLLLGAGLLLLAVLYQWMETSGMLHLPVLASIMAFNGQVVLVESTLMGYMASAALWFRRR